MPIARFLDPKNDFVFRKIFGTEKNKDILIHFLNDILGYRGSGEITEVTFMKTVQDPEISAYRQSIVDVMCKDAAGTQFIVEMQVSKHKGFEKRAQYYAAKAYSQQVIKEDENHKKLEVYAKLKGVIFLAIADFIMFPEKDGWKSMHRVLDTRTYEHDLKDFYFIFMELQKFNKPIDQLANLEEKWAYFLKHAEYSTLDEIEHLVGNDQILQRAFEAINQAAWTEEELRTYEHVEKTRLDNLAVYAQKLEDAEAKGKSEGKSEGKAEGRVEIAKNLLKAGVHIKIITESTGLTKEEIEKL